MLDLPISFNLALQLDQFLDAVVDDALTAGIRSIWFQLDLGNEAAARRAEAAGMRVVWDRCTAIELRRRQHVR